MVDEICLTKLQCPIDLYLHIRHIRIDWSLGQLIQTSQVDSKLKIFI